MGESTGTLITVVICILLISVIFMAVVEVTVPIFKKIELNSIAEKYMALIEMNSGLTVIERNELEATLTSSGFENISIAYPLQGTVRFGDSLELDIETTYDYRVFGDLTSISEILEINFSDDITNRRIEN